MLPEPDSGKKTASPHFQLQYSVEMRTCRFWKLLIRILNVEKGKLASGHLVLADCQLDALQGVRESDAELLD